MPQLCRSWALTPKTPSHQTEMRWAGLSWMRRKLIQYSQDFQDPDPKLYSILSHELRLWEAGWRAQTPFSRSPVQGDMSTSHSSPLCTKENTITDPCREPACLKHRTAKVSSCRWFIPKSSRNMQEIGNLHPYQNHPLAYSIWEALRMWGMPHLSGKGCLC